MSPDEARAIIEGLEVSQVRFANALGYAPRTVREWLAGQGRIPEHARRLLLLIAASPGLLARLERLGHE
jgi:DNA-binding transcriptional regulator YiaG